MGSLGGGGRSRYGQMCFGMMPVRGAVPLRGRGGAADLMVSGPGILGTEGGQQGAVARLDVLVKQLHSSKGCERARWRRCPEGAGSGGQPQTRWTARFGLARKVVVLTPILTGRRASRGD